METLEREDLKKALKGQFIKAFTKENLDELRAEMKKKLEVLELTYGVRFAIGRMRFEPNAFRCTLKATLKQTRAGVSTEQALWDARCISFGFQKSDYGRSFVFPPDTKRGMAGKTATICGINLKAKKRPIMLKVETKTLNCPGSYVRKRLGIII